VRRHFLHQLYDQYHGAGQQHHHHADEDEEECGDDHEHGAQKCDAEKMRSENLSEELGSDYCAQPSGLMQQALVNPFKEDVERVKVANQASGNELDMMDDEQQSKTPEELRTERKEGFKNPELRALNVSSFLRIVHALLEYAPLTELRINTIRILRQPNVFKSITILCDACEWNQDFGLVQKYLRVMY
jgi:hypothetical protein